MLNFENLVWLLLSLILILTFFPLLLRFIFNLFRFFTFLVRHRQLGTVAVLPLSGAFSYSEKDFSLFDFVTGSLERISYLRPSALILRINSPGGSVAAAQEIYDLIRRVREKGVKVVALLEDVGASGGLYVAMAADKVVANPGTLTGSIGVLVQGLEVKNLFEKIGVGVKTVKAGKYKDILSFAKEMTEEEKRLLEQLVANVHDQFIQVVSERRRIEIEKAREFSDGRVFTGEQAKQLGLVDELGGFEKAKEVALALSGIEPGKERLDHYEMKIPIPRLFLNRFFPGSAIMDSLASGQPFRGPLWLLPLAATATPGVALYWHPRISLSNQAFEEIADEISGDGGQSAHQKNF
jgi:protease-4